MTVPRSHSTRPAPDVNSAVTSVFHESPSVAVTPSVMRSVLLTYSDDVALRFSSRLPGRHRASVGGAGAAALAGAALAGATLPGGALAAG